MIHCIVKERKFWGDNYLRTDNFNLLIITYVSNTYYLASITVFSDDMNDVVNICRDKLMKA